MSILLASMAIASSSMVQKTFIAESLQWRKDREAVLRKPEGWLSVAGLFWLSEGENKLGSGSGHRVMLPAASGAAADVGSIFINKRKVAIKVLAGAQAKVNGAVATGVVPLKTDVDGKPDTVTIGSVSFKIIVRGKRIGVRLYDTNSVYMKEFSGCHWYPVNAAYRVNAKYIAYTPPKKVDILNILGDYEPTAIPGYVEFKLNGQDCKLDAQDEGDTLFLNFKDMTSGTMTYPPGRFLNVPKPKDGLVDLDFNKAVNPPCAFTAFATCPLPPKANILNIRISAGELVHHPAHIK
jgi:uncharacterized protein (DUF1684 family)